MAVVTGYRPPSSPHRTPAEFRFALTSDFLPNSWYCYREQINQPKRQGALAFIPAVAKNARFVGDAMKTPYTTLLLATLLTSFAAIAQDDPHQWLEEVESPRALAWVAERNARTTQELEATEAYRPIFERALKILDSTDRIPLIAFHREHVYNFWQDARHERGIWRRTTLSSYRSANPNWETVLDVDALGRAEGKPWVFKGANCLEPAYLFCLISLSLGDSDAVEVREFDV